MLIDTGENDIRERLSVAYVTAVASRAGLQVTEWAKDKQSVDVTIRPISGSRACIDMQLKATSADIIEGADVVCDLPLKNYNDLRGIPQTHPHYLVILLLPGPLEHWLHLSDEQLAIRGVAAWTSLAGMKETLNTTTVRIRFPFARRFTPGVLVRMIEAAPNVFGGLG